MPYLSDSFNYGKVAEDDLSAPMVRALEESYEQTAVEVNRKPDLVIRSTAPAGTPDGSGHIPSTTDINYRNGTIWIVQTGATAPITNQVYMKTETIVSGGNKTALWVRLI